MPETTPLSPQRISVPFVLRVAGLAAAYLLAAKLSTWLSAMHGLPPPLWPPAGIGLAGVLLLGIRAWPAVAVGALLGNLGASVSLAGAVGIAAGNTLAVVVPAGLLLRKGRTLSLERLSDVLRLLGFGAVLGPAISATIGLVAIRSTTVHSQIESLVLVLTWFLGYVAATVLITPLLLAWLGPSPRPQTGRLAEVPVLFASVVLSAILTGYFSPAYSVLAFPLVTWAAFRFGPRGATLATAAAYFLTVLAVVAAHRQLEDLSPLALRFYYAAFHLSCGVTGLLLAASAAERGQGRQAERELEGSYRALIAGSPLAIIALDLLGRVGVWNHAAENLFGWTAAEVLGRELPTIPPEREAEFRAMFTGLATARSGIQTVRRRRDGSLIDVTISHWPLYDSLGRLAGAMSAQVDISDQKRAERLQDATHRISQAAIATAELKEFYAATHQIVGELLPADNFFIAVHDPETDTLSFPFSVDERAVAIPRRRVARGLTEYVLRTARPLRVGPTSIAELIERGEVEAVDVIASNWLGVPLLAGGRAIGVLGVKTYIQDAQYSEREQAILEFVSSQVAMAIVRKRAEDAVRHSEERFRLVAATTNDMVYECYTDHRPDWWSDNLRSILGYETHEVQNGQEYAWAHLVHPDDKVRAVEGYREAVEGNASLWRREYRLRRKDGSYAWVLDRARIERDANGQCTRVIGAMLDISDVREAREALRRSENQLRQAMKMEAVGRLAGGVAHDFNNLLTSVLGHADLAMDRLGPGDSLYDDLLEIKSAGTRAAALTQQLLAFSRKQVLEPKVVDLNGIVSGIVKMLRRTIGEDVELVTRLAPDLGPVKADPVQIEQVLLNLAVNARDAMPEGGSLTIETANVRLGVGPAVRIRVEDTGIGMSDEVRAHLFEPFFTTKEVGKGTGLGLATAYGIVQQSGGSISVVSEPGRGTTFFVDLPQVGGEPAPVEPPSPHGLGQGWETVLLVEDEESVRNLTRRVLEHHGYHVLSAPNGETAIELSRNHPGEIHLLLTDVVMPGLSGPRLAELLLTERRSLCCIFMSGYAATTLEQRVLLQRDTAFLQKPFTTAQLMRRVRELLDARVSAAT